MYNEHVFEDIFELSEYQYTSVCFVEISDSDRTHSKNGSFKTNGRLK